MRIRVQMAKEHQAKFLSHLDLQRTLERTLRRAQIPVAFTQGFNPHPRMSVATALATGTSSEGEFVDVDLQEEMDPQEFLERANAAFPAGLRFTEAHMIPGKGESLFQTLNAATYRLTLRLPEGGPDLLQQALDALFRRDEVLVEKIKKRKRRMVNIRPQVYELRIEDSEAAGDGGVTVRMHALLQSGAQGSLKPEDLLEGLQQLAPELSEASLVEIHRLMLYRRDPETGVLTTPWEL